MSAIIRSSSKARARSLRRERGREPARKPPARRASLTAAGAAHILRPSFAALVAAEDELGPLFALVERAGAGQLKMAEMAALFWHCLAPPHTLTREQLGEAVAEAGLAASAKPLRALLAQILQGSG